MFCDAHVFGHDDAAEQRIHQLAVASVATDEFRGDANDVLLLQQVDRMDGPEVVERVDCRAAKVLADEQFDGRKGVFLRFDDDGMQAIGECGFNRAF